MKKPISISIIFTVVLLLFQLPSFAQSLSAPTPNDTKPVTCGTHKLHEKKLLTDPVYANQMKKFDEAWMKYTPAKSTGAATLYRVPVVVHLMHKGEAIGEGTNLTDAAVRDGIKELNERFRALDGEWGTSTGSDMELEFALAIRDESGNCTNGIVRYDMSAETAYMNCGVDYSSGCGISDGDLKLLSRWDPTKYYNIYIVSEIDGSGGNVAGYAYYASAHGLSYDGTVMMAKYFASAGNNTITHELGHAFNLYHTFEGDNDGSGCPPVTNGCGSGQGDCCADVPPHIRSSSDCIVGTNSCDGGSSTELFIHNYMDYSAKPCRTEFTADQVSRSRTALTSQRTSFTTSDALTPPAAPTADFSSEKTGACVGTTIQFKDISSCIPNTYLNNAWSGITHSWSFDNGSDPVINSTDQNPSITFNNPGLYEVSLTVTSAQGTDTKTVSEFINIISSSPDSACVPGSGNEGNFTYTVSNVKFNTIDNSTSITNNYAYTDYSCDHITTVKLGQTYELSVTVNVNSSYDENVDVYIDFNNDAVFSSSEKVMSEMLPMGSGDSTFTDSITIPDTIDTYVPLRMRVLGEAGTIGNACSFNFVGDVEDYAIFPVPVSCEITKTVCDEYSSPGGQVWNSSGTYYDTVNNAPSCANVITYQLTVGYSDTAYVDTTIIQGDVIYVGGGYQANAGTYYDYLTNSGGCDSTVITTVSVVEDTTADTNSTFISENLWKNNVQVIPNPFEEEFMISGVPANDISRLYITDITGRKLNVQDKIRVVDDKLIIKSSNWVRGVYFINIWLTSEEMIVTKVIRK